MSSPEVVLIEFNELSPSLIHRFMAEGRLPNFARLYRESQVYTTDAGEQPPNLEPWIQWVSVHSGMDFQDHGVFHLGDGSGLQHKCVWDVLSDAGHVVWVCGSMNVRYDRPLNGWVVPDPWTIGAAPYPDALRSYFRFVQAHVQEYTNDRVPLTAGDHLRFFSFMLRHGFSASTLRSILAQLLAERSAGERWKRAVIMDKLQFDVFRAVRRSLRPRFSTFFLNSTAHFQHLYWRNLEPDLFKVRPTPQEQAAHGEAIAFGYEQMDGLIGGFLDMAGPDTTLVFCTALSQQPCLIYEEKGGKVFYRPRDFEQLLALAGVTAPHTVSPVMAEQFHVHFANESEAEGAHRALSLLRVGDRPVMSVHRNGAAVFGGCGIFETLAREAVLVTEGKQARFFDVFYQVEGVKSGMHHPDGMLWIRRPGGAHAVHPDKVALTSIAPTILDWFSVAAPAHMKGDVLDAQRPEELVPARASL